mmetsp:Transcript_22419/g.42759  ORF Transcript_22419/g.42759 Transcript_22419/m.42759 type:complete len:317 (-) Transcript_22419:907-1857(-)
MQNAFLGGLTQLKGLSALRAPERLQQRSQPRVVLNERKHARRLVQTHATLQNRHVSNCALARRGRDASCHRRVHTQNCLPHRLDCSVVLGMVEPSEGQVAMTAAPAVKSEGASGLHAKGCLLSKLADALQLKHICFSERPRLSREQAPPERGPEVRAAARALRRRLPHALLRRKHACELSAVVLFLTHAVRCHPPPQELQGLGPDAGQDVHEVGREPGAHAARTQGDELLHILVQNRQRHALKQLKLWEGSAMYAHLCQLVQLSSRHLGVGMAVDNKSDPQLRPGGTQGCKQFLLPEQHPHQHLHALGRPHRALVP